MKTWIKRSLAGLLGVGILAGGLSACSHRYEGHGRHGMSMSSEDETRMQGKFVEKVSKELELTEAQKQHLVTVAERAREQRKALIGSTTDPRAELQALVSGERFDRARALAIIEEKTQAVRGKSPEVIAAMADFYDSLTPAQQQELRDHLQKRHRWFGRS